MSSLLSPAYMNMAVPCCFRLFMQEVRCAFCFALAKAGNNMAAKIAMMAMTTNSSINVNPDRKEPLYERLLGLQAAGLWFERIR